MWFCIKNTNLAAYPHIANTFPLNTIICLGGAEANTLEINTIEELLSLDAICKADNEYYLGMRIDGNTITLVEKEYFAGEQTTY